jgi:hypothetical protein
VIVEVDGGSHRGRERADGRRQRALEAAGYRVVRFEVRQVMQQLPSVLAVLRAAVAERGGSKESGLANDTAPSPDPFPKGAEGSPARRVWVVGGCPYPPRGGVGSEARPSGSAPAG